MGLSESLKTPALISKELVRRTVRRFRSSHFVRWPASFTVPDRLVYALPDLSPKNPELAAEFYNGSFLLASELVETKGESPFTTPVASADWQRELHSFSWLRHLSAADTNLSRVHACGLLQDWVVLWGEQISSRSWQIDTTVKRLLAWCSHAPGLSADTHVEQTRILTRSLVKQMRHLHQILPLQPVNTQRLMMTATIACCALCLDQREKAISACLKDLDKELERQVLSDGCPLSRNPGDIVTLLAVLIPLRSLHQTSGKAATSHLLTSIDRLMAALKFFQHSNGELGQFNSTGETPFELLKTLRKYDQTSGVPQKSVPNGGYERLAKEKSVVLIDCGKPKSIESSDNALAGTLSFELSAGKNVFISNCGVTTLNRDLYFPYSRASAAHSTAIIGETSSSRFTNRKRLQSWLHSSLIRSPDTINVSRNITSEYDQIDCSHDGYKRSFGIVHRRVLQLSKDGNTLNGADHFMPWEKQIQTSHDVCLRFHIPPQVNASILSNGHSILLAAPNREAWLFSCIDAPIALEESIQFTGPGNPRKTVQIVVSGQTAHHPEIRWAIEYRMKKAAERTIPASETMGDLLAPLLDPPFKPEGTF